MVTNSEIIVVISIPVLVLILVSIFSYKTTKLFNRIDIYQTSIDFYKNHPKHYLVKRGLCHFFIKNQSLYLNKTNFPEIFEALEYISPTEIVFTTFLDQYWFQEGIQGNHLRVKLLEKALELAELKIQKK